MKVERPHDAHLYTMVNTGAHWDFLEILIKKINKKDIEGAVVECGVWKGGVCMWMLYCQKQFNMDREFYLYDTFDGMTRPDHPKDDPKALKTYDEITSGVKLRAYDDWHGQNKWACAPLEHVKDNIRKVEYDDKKITFVEGDCCETLDKIVPSKISLLRLDTDWYESTKKELDILYPLVSKGGYIVVDDYYHWLGSKTATDEFLKNRKPGEISIIDKTEAGGIFTFKKLI